MNNKSSQLTDSLAQYGEKLEKANSIISAIAAENKNITPILPSDYSLFSSFFGKERRHTYGNSWLYITQGTFGIGPEQLGYKYYDGENLCALAIYPKLENPDIIMMYWIRPLGAKILPAIVSLAKEIKQKYGVYSYVKKLFPDQYEYLVGHGFKSAEEFPWHSSAHSEDDTFPELIYNRENFLEFLNNPTNRTQLGRTLKEINKFRSNNNVLVTSEDFTQHAWDIVSNYFEIRGDLTDKPNVSTRFDYYNMIFPDYSHDPNIEKRILLINDEPVGFYALMHNDKFNVTSIYSYITLRNKYKYLTDLLKVFVMETSSARYINSGGSEDEGIHNFKMKYLPADENLMYWATNYSE